MKLCLANTFKNKTNKKKENFNLKKHRGKNTHKGRKILLLYCREYKMFSDTLWNLILTYSNARENLLFTCSLSFLSFFPRAVKKRDKNYSSAFHMRALWKHGAGSINNSVFKHLTKLQWEVGMVLQIFKCWEWRRRLLKVPCSYLSFQTWRAHESLSKGDQGTDQSEAQLQCLPKYSGFFLLSYWQEAQSRERSHLPGTIDTGGSLYLSVPSHFLCTSAALASTCRVWLFFLAFYVQTQYFTEAMRFPRQLISGNYCIFFQAVSHLAFKG